MRWRTRIHWIICVVNGLPVALIWPSRELVRDLRINETRRQLSDPVDDRGGISHGVRSIGWEFDPVVRAGAPLPANVRH